MFNKIFAIIILSIIVVVIPSYAEQGMAWLLMVHAMIIDFLASIFSDAQLGRVIRDLLGLLALPLAAGLVPALIYWVVKRRSFPYFVFIVWTAWLLQLGALVAIHKI